MGNYIAGYGGSITVTPTIGVGGTLCVTNWSANWSSDFLNVTTTCANGWREGIYGVSQVDISVDSFYDPTVDPITVAGLGLTPGAFVTMSLKVGISASTFVGEAIVESVEIGSPVRGACPFKMTAKSTGSWTFTP